MSLDVHLTVQGAKIPLGSGIFVRDGGRTREVSIEEWNEMHPDREPVAVQREVGATTDVVFDWNITHNLTQMASAVGIYQHLWRPEELGISKAGDLVEPLKEGLRRLKRNPEECKQFNPENGWGSYEVLVEFVEQYLLACIVWPEAEISVSR